MRLHEYEAADIFESAGIAIPERGVVDNPEAAARIANEFAVPVMVKAQVLAGGRGKAGGIKSAQTADDAYTAAAEILDSTIHGIPVDAVLVSMKKQVERELYLGVTVDGYNGVPVVMVSTMGGVSIEEAAVKHPDKMASVRCNPCHGLFPYQARAVMKNAGFSRPDSKLCEPILLHLYSIFRNRNAMIAEINPIGITEDGKAYALDAVLDIDNSALRRLGDTIPQKGHRYHNELEHDAAKIGVTYVDLDGDIGIISSGAGLGMAAMDIIGRQLRPANFLETGGGITESLMYDCMELIMKKPGIRAVFINVYGGINPIHEGAKGIVRYIKKHGLAIPVVAKALGNRQEETWDILRKGGVHVVTDIATEKAVEKVIKVLNTNK